MEYGAEPYKENVEVVAMVGRVALLFEAMKGRPGAIALTRAPDNRPVGVDMVTQGLDSMTTVQIGLVTPSTAQTQAASQTRHPSASPRPHLELWQTRKNPRSSQLITTNYRFYEPPDAKILQPRADSGRAPRSLTPETTPERWNNLLKLLTSIEKIVRPH